MNETATVTYIKKTKNKNRLITTYKKNDLGRKLRVNHKVAMNYISHHAKQNDLAYAYTKNKSTQMMVKKHINSKYFLYVDIESFFPSIDLTILKEKSAFLINKNLPEEDLYHLIDSCKLKDDKGLAIGLIPSAFFSNVYLEDFDLVMEKFLKNLDLDFIYSRYSDDIVISNSNDFNMEEVVHKIKIELALLKLNIHESKIKFKHLKNHSDHIKILGLSIIKGNKGNYISVSRRFKRNTRKTKNINSRKGKVNYIAFSEFNKFKNF